MWNNSLYKVPLRQMYYSFLKRFLWLNYVKEAQCLAQRQEKWGGIVTEGCK